MSVYAQILDFLLAGLEDQNGNPLSGGKVYSYAAGTTTSKDTYTDRAKTSPSTNPIVLDIYGRAVVYGDGLYKFVIKDSADNTIKTIDNYNSLDVADHSVRHEDGGADEISVTGLSGLLGDDQHVLDIEVINLVYPIGSIYVSVVSTNPGTLFGTGTWVAFGAGKVLVGLDAGQTEFDTVEETGGAKTHALSIAEMPAHTHTQTRTDFTITADNAGVRAGPTTTVNTGSTGGGEAHNNLQPYIVCYFWKRVS